MRDLIADYVGGPKSHLAKVVLGEMMPMAVAHAFFGLCREVGRFTEAEKAIAGRLERNVADEVTERNHYFHGDWYLGGFRVGDEALSARRERILPHRKVGPVQVDVLNAQQIDERSEAVLALTGDVYEFGRLSLGLVKVSMADGGRQLRRVRVSDVFVAEGGNKRTPLTIVRSGPLADRIVRRVRLG